MDKAPTIPDGSPGLDAASARILVNQSLNEARERMWEYHDLHVSLAAKHTAVILANIQKAAQAGKTDLRFILRHRSLPKLHRTMVLPLIKCAIDERGFNVLTQDFFSLLGAYTLFQIEW